MPNYAGGTNVNATFPADTRTLVVDGLKGHLVTAGWSVASGATGDWRLDSAVTPDGMQMRVRLLDSGAGASGRIIPSNPTETLIGNAGFLVAVGGSTYRVIANKYQFFVLQPTSIVSRTFYGAGVPAIPAHLIPSITETFWAHGNAESDGDTTIRDSWRTTMEANSTSTTIVMLNGLLSGIVFNFGLVVPMGTRLDPATAYRWFNDDRDICDAEIAYNPDQAESKSVGFLWDAIVMTGPLVMDLSTTYDTHTFYSITNGYQGGSLLVVVP